MKFHYLSLLALTTSLLFVCCAQIKTKVKSAVKESNLIWSDEFEIDGLPDTRNWSYDKGDGCPHVCGWGNNELQYYTANEKNNARVEDGNLIIEVHKQTVESKNYTSARLVTKGHHDWKYGTVEVRAKLPKGLGTWPAIWMLPSHNKYGGWPRSGEIDIMEHVGYSPDSVLGTVHTEAYNHMIGTHVAGAIVDKQAESGFHTYKIVWREDAISWYMDDKLYHTFSNKNRSFKEWPFDEEFHLILNLAVGGNWGGKHGVSDDIWPQQFVIDYVRVYQH